MVLRRMHGMGPLRALKDINDCPKAVAWHGKGTQGHHGWSRLMRGMGSLRTLKDIPEGPKADVWHGNP